MTAMFLSKSQHMSISHTTASSAYYVSITATTTGARAPVVPDFSHFLWLFPSHFQIPWPFLVLRVRGDPGNSCVVTTYVTISQDNLPTVTENGRAMPPRHSWAQSICSDLDSSESGCNGIRAETWRGKPTFCSWNIFTCSSTSDNSQQMTIIITANRSFAVLTSQTLRDCGIKPVHSTFTS